MGQPKPPADTSWVKTTEPTSAPQEEPFWTPFVKVYLIVCAVLIGAGVLGLWWVALLLDAILRRMNGG